MNQMRRTCELSDWAEKPCAGADGPETEGVYEDNADGDGGVV